MVCLVSGHSEVYGTTYTSTRAGPSLSCIFKPRLLMSPVSSDWSAHLLCPDWCHLDVVLLDGINNFNVLRKSRTSRGTRRTRKLFFSHPSMSVIGWFLCRLLTNERTDWTVLERLLVPTQNFRRNGSYGFHYGASFGL